MNDTELKKCFVKMHEGNVCKRSIYVDSKGNSRDWCICHCEKLGLDCESKAFQHELSNSTYNDGKIADFTAFVFPCSGWQIIKEHMVPCYFDRATFNGRADFSGSNFQSEVTFNDVMMKDGADFSHCYFGDTVVFSSSSFQSATGATIDFRYCTFNEPSKVLFKNVNLSNALFVGTDISTVSFVTVTWYKRIPNFYWLRKKVFDEVSFSWWKSARARANAQSSKFKRFWIIVSSFLYFKSESILGEETAQVYRHLQFNLESNYRYGEAGDFYIGEREVIRKAKGPVNRFLSADFIYKWISSYGQSILRPFFWLMLVLLLFPALFLSDGIYLEEPSDILKIQPVKYNWSWDINNCLLKNSDYWQAFALNFNFVTFDRSRTHKHLLTSWARFGASVEQILVIVFVSFYVIALRRRFKRKSF